MKQHLMLVAAVCALCAASVVYAYPSLLGPTGGANLPNAQVIQQGKIAIAGDYVNDQSDDTGLGNSYIFRGLYGIAPSFEIGATLTAQKFLGVDSSTANSNAWGVNAKYRLNPTAGNFDLAIGADYQNFPNFDPDKQEIFQAYIVGTRVFSRGSCTAPAVRGSIGANWTKVTGPVFYDDGFGNTFVVDQTDTAVRPFVSLDMVFPNRVNLQAEYQFKNDNLESNPLASIVARYPFSPTLFGEAGVTNALDGVFGTNKQNFFFGLNYLFGNAR